MIVHLGVSRELPRDPGETFPKPTRAVVVRSRMDVLSALHCAIDAVFNETGEEPSHVLVGSGTRLEIQAILTEGSYSRVSSFASERSQLSFRGVPVHVDSSRTYSVVAVPRDITWCAVKGPPRGSIVLPAEEAADGDQG